MSTMWKHPRSIWPNVWMGWTYGDSNASKETVANRVQQCSVPFNKWGLIDQTHSDIVRNVSNAGSQGEGDALFTAVPNIGLVVQTADCVPIFLIGKFSFLTVSKKFCTPLKDEFKVTTNSISLCLLDPLKFRATSNKKK